MQNFQGKRKRFREACSLFHSSSLALHGNDSGLIQVFVENIRSVFISGFKEQQNSTFRINKNLYQTRIVTLYAVCVAAEKAHFEI